MIDDAASIARTHADHIRRIIDDGQAVRIDVGDETTLFIFPPEEEGDDWTVRIRSNAIGTTTYCIPLCPLILADEFGGLHVAFDIPDIGIDIRIVGNITEIRAEESS